MKESLYTTSSLFETPIIEDDDITSDYAYKINYGQSKVKMHHKDNETPEHTIFFPNTCSFTLLLDLPHNVLNKLDDYTLDYGPLSYETSGSIFKESYILSGRPPWDYADYIVSASYGSSGGITLLSQSNGDIDIYGDNDAIGTIQDAYCKINVPFLVDASGSRIEANLEMTTKKIKGKDKDIFRYSVDPTWLDNAVYPVIIDPSITLYSTSNNLACYQPWNNMFARLSNGNMITGHGERTTWRIRAIIANGDNFSNPTFVTIATDTTFVDYQNFIVTNTGRCVCIYRSRSGTRHVYSRYSDDNGLNWSSPVTIVGGYSANGLVAILDQDNNIWVVTENGSTYLFVSSNNGGSWTNKGLAATSWYPDICENRKDRQLVVITSVKTNAETWVRVWDIDADGWVAAAELLPTTGRPATIRVLPSGLDCDLQGNVVFYLRVQYQSDSVYRLWRHTWLSGSALSTATGSVVSIGGSELFWGDCITDRDGNFHANMFNGSLGAYYSNGNYKTVGQTWTKKFDTLNRTDYNQIYLMPWDKDSISEFHQTEGDYNAVGPVYSLFYRDGFLKKVGPDIMGMVGG